jgi:hypothetical protein
VKLSAPALARLREMAGDGVRVGDMAAVLRVQFGIEITAEILNRDYSDEMRVGRALEIERVSRSVKATAIEGSPGAQKAWLDQIREVDPAAGSKGQRIKLIRLVVEDVDYQKQRRAHFATAAKRKAAAKAERASKASSATREGPPGETDGGSSDDEAYFSEGPIGFDG